MRGDATSQRRRLAADVFTFGLGIGLIAFGQFGLGRPASAAEGPLSGPLLGLLDPANKDLYSEVSGKCTAATRLMEALVQTQQSGRLASQSPANAAKAIAAIDALKRGGERLQHLGEPSGVDFQRRGVWLEGLWKPIADQVRSTAKGQQFNQAATRKFSTPQRIKQRASDAQAIQKLLESGRNLQAEARLDKLLARDKPETGLLPHSVQAPIWTPFAGPNSVIKQRMEVERRRQAAQSLAALRAAAAPNIASIVQVSQDTARSIAQSGAAQLGSASYDGPGAYQQIARQWKIGHLALLHVQGIEMARADVLPSGTPDQLTQIRQAHQQFQRDMAGALMDLVVGDVGRADAAEAESLYLQHLDATAALAANADREVRQFFQQRLQQAAAKHAGLSQAAANYAAATDELLKWRRRAAAARAAARQSASKAAAAGFQALRSDRRLQGLLPSSSQNSDTPQLLGSVPEVRLLAESRKLIGAAVYCDQICASQPTAARKLSRLLQRTYVTCPASWDLAAELQQLRQDLLVTDAAPPLSLTAATAIKTAENGAFVRGGGTVAQVFAESLPLRWATLPAPAWNLAPLGTVPQETVPDYLDEALLHYELTPQWLQHEFFFLEAGPPEQS